MRRSPRRTSRSPCASTRTPPRPPTASSRPSWSARSATSAGRSCGRDARTPSDGALPGDWSSDGARGARVRRGHRGPCHARGRVLAGPRLGGGGGGRHSRHPRRDLREHRRAARAGGRLPGSPAEPDRPGIHRDRGCRRDLPDRRSRRSVLVGRPPGARWPGHERALRDLRAVLHDARAVRGHARRPRARERSSPGARCRVRVADPRGDARPSGSRRPARPTARGLHGRRPGDGDDELAGHHRDGRALAAREPDRGPAADRAVRRRSPRTPSCSAPRSSSSIAGSTRRCCARAAPARPGSPRSPSSKGCC